MQAFILAAGRGSRLKKLTENNPKPLVKIAGRPVMEYVIKLLAANGFDEIGVNLFYLGEQVEKYFGTGKKYGVSIKYIYEKELTGTAGGVKSIARVIKPKNPFFVVPGDWISNFNLASIYKFHCSKKSILTLSVIYKSRDPIKDSGVVAFDKNTKKVLGYVQKPKTKEEIISYWSSTGIYVMDPRFLDYIPEKIDDSKIVDIPKDVFPIFMSSKEKNKMYAYSVNRNKFYQLGINSEEQIKQVEEDMESGVYKPV